MGAWGTSIFSDDLAQDVRREYNILLSVGKDNNEVEKMLIKYYASILSFDNPDGDVFWLALALCEWKKGRLTSEVKANALAALESGRDLERWNTVGNQKNYLKRKKVLKDFHDVVLTPPPTIMKIRKPTVHHCPWKVGSLLAYRIVSNKQVLNEHPCFMKYVLLRVVKIEKHSVSKLFETEYYDETMFIGLYNYIGSTIPDLKIASKLKYIPFNDCAPTITVNAIDSFILNRLPEELKNSINKSILSSFEKKIVMCEQLDWLPVKGMQGDITYLDCDENYLQNVPECINTSIINCPMSNYFSFDITLARKFENYLDKSKDFDYILI